MMKFGHIFYDEIWIDFNYWTSFLFLFFYWWEGEIAPRQFLFLFLFYV